MKKSVKMNKKVLAGIGMALTIAACTGGLAVSGNFKSKADQFNGTARDWDATLPHNNGNKYFKPRTKETYSTKGWVSVEKFQNCPGVSVWFNTNNNVKITDIRRINTKIKKELTYASHCQPGNTVYLGVENQDATSVIRGRALGQLNYK